MHLKKILFTVFFFLFALTLLSQNQVVTYTFSKKEPELEKIFSKTNFKDSTLLIQYLDKKIKSSYLEGFLEISIDSMVSKSNHNIVYIYVGQRYNHLKIRYDTRYEAILRQINSAYLSEEFLDLSQIKNENKKLVTYLENNGYPFSKVELDSITFIDNTLFAKLSVERGEEILLDTIKVHGNLKISKSFLYGYIGLRPKDPFNLVKVQGIKKRINNLNFAQQTRETQIIYKDKKVDILVPAIGLSNNRFDGILGILPNDETTGKLVLTGEINIFLENMFKSAEELNFKWQKLESSSQKLDIDFKIPYIFNTNLGISAGLNIHKQDSTYLNALLKTGVQYYFQGKNHIGLQYKNKTSAVLSKDSIIIKQYSPFQISTLGLNFSYKSLDYNFNPHRGIDIFIEANLGSKNFLTDANLPVSKIQYDGKYKIKWFIPLAKKHTLLIANRTAFLLADNLFQNELYKIGGLSTLRGFMESSIYASSYSIATIEYRFIFERNSALFTFFDAAWYEKKIENYYYDYPFGFGLGLFFKTKAGIFTISYAMGEQRNENLNIKNAKIHFGFINRF